MELAEACLICGSKDLLRVPAVMAEFIRRRCLISGEVTLRRIWCPACDFSFYDHRLDDAETERLYRGYRQGPYDRDRIAVEPGYAELAPLFADRTSAYHTTRQTQTKALFDAWEVPFRTVLDYGGEPDAWMTRAIFPDREVRAYDLSDASLPPEGQTFDLVFCAHVLEHVSFPLPFMQSLRPFVRPGGFLYLEVPIEYGEGSQTNTIRADHPMRLMHEHVSFYSPRALAKLLFLAGFKPLDVRYLGEPHGTSLAMLACLPEDVSRAGDRLLRHGNLPADELEALIQVWAFQSLERHGDAILLLEDFLGRHPDHGIALAALAASMQRLEDPESAEALLLAAIEADPAYAPSFLRLSGLCRAKGDMTMARTLLETGLDQNPTSLPLWRELIGLSAMNRDPRLPQDAWDALQAVPEGGGGLWHQIVASALWETREEARGVLASGLALFPDHAGLHALQARMDR
ncbi:MAG TPA: methyltransferase domain-containing protein [Holophaga sp.]|nr:methyltransferase domain-containing protein [Holophaga sp.]